MYGVKLGIRYNGQEYSAGMALSLVADGGGVKSQFLFDAGRFAIINNAQSGAFTLPFVVENNQVFINSLLVKNGSIGNAQIADQINSNNWQSGAAGWMINKNGYAEFNQITVRGTVYANAGSFTGNVYATDGWFRGTVYAEKIEGDVAKAVVLPFNGSVHIPAVNYNRHLVIPYVGIHGYTYSGGTWGGGTVWVDSTYGGRLANVQATAMHGGSSGYVLLPAGNATTLSYGGNLNHANAVPILTVLLFKA